jgi:hypothetical protein
MFEDAMNFRFAQEEIEIFPDRKVFTRKERKVATTSAFSAFFASFATLRALCG